MENNYRNKSQDKRLTNIENHIGVINSELGSVKADISQLRTDVSWIKRFIFILLPTLGGVGVSLIYMVLKLRSI